MTLYAKKNIPISAQQYNFGTLGARESIWAFTGGLVKWSDLTPYSNEEDGIQVVQAFVFDYLHNTWVEFKSGDWIIKGIRGEFYPVEESVFEETYEEYVEDRDSPV